MVLKIDDQKLKALQKALKDYYGHLEHKTHGAHFTTQLATLEDVLVAWRDNGSKSKALAKLLGSFKMPRFLAESKSKKGEILRNALLAINPDLMAPPKFDMTKFRNLVEATRAYTAALETDPNKEDINRQIKLLSNPVYSFVIHDAPEYVDQYSKQSFSDIINHFKIPKILIRDKRQAAKDLLKALHEVNPYQPRESKQKQSTLSKEEIKQIKEKKENDFKILEKICKRSDDPFNIAIYPHQASINITDIHGIDIHTITDFILTHSEYAIYFLHKIPGADTFNGRNFRRELGEATDVDLVSKLIMQGDKDVRYAIEASDLLGSRHLQRGGRAGVLRDMLELRDRPMNSILRELAKEDKKKSKSG